MNYSLHASLIINPQHSLYYSMLFAIRLYTCDSTSENVRDFARHYTNDVVINSVNQKLKEYDFIEQN